METAKPEILALFQLAWTQVALCTTTEGHSVVAKQDPEKFLSWEKTEERWEDEVQGIASRTRCRMDPRLYSTRLDQISDKDLKRFLFPLFSHYELLNPLTRSLLRKYAFFLWGVQTADKALYEELKGALPTLMKRREQEPHSVEACQVEALYFLIQNESKTPLQKVSLYEQYFRQCGGDDPLFGIAMKIEGGDAYWNAREMGKAFTLFEKALRPFQGRKIPAEYAYRLAVSGFLSGAKDDLVLRLADESLKDPQIQPLFKSSLKNLVCSQLSQLGSKASQTLMESVFGASHWVDQAVFLTQECEDPLLIPLWKRAVLLAKSPQEKSTLLGLLLRSLIQERKFSEARGKALELVRISEKFKFLGSIQFWGAIDFSLLHSDQHRKELLQLARFYVSHASESSFDTQKLKRLEAVDGASDSIKKDSHMSMQKVSIPLVMAIPSVPMNLVVQENFVELFYKWMPMENR